MLETEDIDDDYFTPASRYLELYYYFYKTNFYRNLLLLWLLWPYLADIYESKALIY